LSRWVRTQKVKTVDALPDGATVALPNGTSGRLSTGTFITGKKQSPVQLEEPRGTRPKDIGENPKHLHSLNLRTVCTSAYHGEVDMVLINTNFVFKANLNSLSMPLFTEDKAIPTHL